MGILPKSEVGVMGDDQAMRPIFQSGTPEKLFRHEKVCVMSRRAFGTHPAVSCDPTAPALRASAAGTTEGSVRSTEVGSEDPA